MNSFTKHNPIPGSISLLCEVRGLEELRGHGLAIPAIEESSKDFIKMQRIESVKPSDEDWERLGKGLADIHEVTSEQFGFAEDNFIGLNEQKNSPSDNWGEFYFENRLLFQVELVKDPRVKEEFLEILNQRKSKMIENLNSHEPKASLLHGDLWSGNVMFDKSGPWLIDPAVYYGDRETDLAMTEVFGGFSPIFYKTYFSLYQKPEGHDYRNGLYKLYHYLNHYNLFGDSYLSQVKSLLT